jgi:hypothetical protein
MAWALSNRAALNARPAEKGHGAVSNLFMHVIGGS